MRWENKIGDLNYYQFNLLLEKQNLSWNLKDAWELPQCLTVILASPLLTGRTCSWKISFADACQGWEECVSTVSATLWLPCQNPTEAAAGQDKEQDQDGIPTAEKKKKELFVTYRSRLPFQAWKALLLVWPDLFLWSSSDLLIKHWAWQAGKQKDGQRTTVCQGLNSRSASPGWAAASGEAEERSAAPRTRKRLEEHFHRSLYRFYFLLRTTPSCYFILNAYLWALEWTQNVTDLVTTRMVSPLVLMRREKSPGLVGWSVRPEKEWAPGGGTRDPASAGAVSSMNADFRRASQTLGVIIDVAWRSERRLLFIGKQWAAKG